MKRMKRGVMAATVLAAGLGAVAPVSASQQAERIGTDDVVAAVDEYQQRLDRAAALEELAREATEDLKTFPEAVKMYHEAAELRGESPEAVQDLIQAAHLSFYLGDESAAIAGLAKAGRAARSWDDVLTAADAFLDAAWVAQDRGWARQAIRLAAEAEELSHSHLISSAHRHQILERIADMQE